MTPTTYEREKALRQRIEQLEAELNELYRLGV